MHTPKRGSVLLIIFFIMIGITIIATSFSRALSWYADSIREHEQYWKKQYQYELFLAHCLAHYYEHQTQGSTMIALANHQYQLTWQPGQQGIHTRLKLQIFCDAQAWASGYAILSKKDAHFYLLQRHIVYESSDQK
jgi:hypothetical protein